MKRITVIKSFKTNLDENGNNMRIQKSEIKNNRKNIYCGLNFSEIADIIPNNNNYKQKKN